MKTNRTRRNPHERKEKSPLILINADDSTRRSIQLFLSAHGYDVRAFAASAAVLAHSTALDASRIVVDEQMPDAEGTALLAELSRRGWRGTAVLTTASSSPDLVAAARTAGCDTVLEMPVRPHSLLTALDDRVEP